MSIEDIGKLIRTQDNRITDQPVFIVERQRTEWGYGIGHSDDYKWLNPENDYSEADEEETERLDELDNECGDTGNWQKVFYKHYWEFVTPCFTEQGCKDYLAQNGHNLGVTRIYAHGSYRNDEWQAVRKHLIDASLETEGKPKPSLKQIAFEKREEAEKAMYEYFCSCEIGQKREQAGRFYENIRIATRIG